MISYPLIIKILKVATFAVGVLTFLQLIFPPAVPVLLAYLGFPSSLELGGQLFVAGAGLFVLLLVLLFWVEHRVKKQGVALSKYSSQTNVIIIAIPTLLFCLVLACYASVFFVFGGYFQALGMYLLAGLVGVAALWLIMRRID